MRIFFSTCWHGDIIIFEKSDTWTFKRIVNAIYILCCCPLTHLKYIQKLLYYTQNYRLRKKGKWFLIGHEKVFYKNQPSNLKASLYKKTCFAYFWFFFSFIFLEEMRKNWIQEECDNPFYWTFLTPRYTQEIHKTTGPKIGVIWIQIRNYFIFFFKFIGRWVFLTVFTPSFYILKEFLRKIDI